MPPFFQSIRRWAVIASLITLFGGTSLPANSIEVTTDDAPPCIGCADDTPHKPSFRRFHSDLL